MSESTSSREERLNNQRLIETFARLEPKAFGLSCGILGAVGLFLVTVVLVVRGPGHSEEFEGAHTGPHLGLLSYYLPGYEVTWIGSVIGLFWGLVVGFVLGAAFAWLLNFHHTLYLRVIERGFRRQGLLDG